MTLIKCPECIKEISDNASVCPNCGSPVNNHGHSNKSVEIELSGKKWKKRFILAILLMLIGWITMIKFGGLGYFIFFIGVVVGISAGIGRWWTNG